MMKATQESRTTTGKPAENTAPGGSDATTPRPAFPGLNGRAAFTPKPESGTAFSLPEVRFTFDVDRLIDEAIAELKTWKPDCLVNYLVSIHSEFDDSLQKRRASEEAGEELDGCGISIDHYANLIAMSVIMQRFNSLDTAGQTAPTPSRPADLAGYIAQAACDCERLAATLSEIKDEEVLVDCGNADEFIRLSNALHADLLQLFARVTLGDQIPGHVDAVADARRRYRMSLGLSPTAA